MTALEQIVLPLAESRALVEAGIVLETAMRWVKNHYNQAPFAIPVWFPPADGEVVLCPAPVLSELLDAIRAKVKLMSGEIEVILGRDESEAEASCAALRINGGYARNLSLGSTDLLAAYALLLEVTK